jgi:hypothetical protein
MLDRLRVVCKIPEIWEKVGEKEMTIDGWEEIKGTLENLASNALDFEQAVRDVNRKSELATPLNRLAGELEGAAFTIGKIVEFHEKETG